MYMNFYAIPNKLREYRKALGLSQCEIADLLNMEQTTYSKKEMGKNPISYETASAISKIIGKNLDEFLENNLLINNISDSTFNNSSVTGDVVNTFNHSMPEKIIKSLEDLIIFVKENYKKVG